MTPPFRHRKSRCVGATKARLGTALLLTALLNASCSSGQSGASGSFEETDASEETGTDQSDTTTKEAQREPVQVERVIDGDSVELILDGQTVEARLLDYNAPELYDDNDELSCAGLTAKELLEAFVASGPVGVSGDETDRFGRRLVVLDIEGTPASEFLIGAGWALASDGAGTPGHQQMLTAAEGQLGMWGPGGCGAPSASTLRIIDSQVDPPGSDRDNLNDEWVRVGNIGDTPVDLSGWVLRDKTTGNQYVFGPLTIAPDAVVTVRSGAGTNSATDLYWDQSFPVWSNTDEVILLQDPAGVVAHWLFL